MLEDLQALPQACNFLTLQQVIIFLIEYKSYTLEVDHKKCSCPVLV